MHDTMEQELRKWFEDSRENNLKTIEQTETLFEQRVLQIASGAMAISFSFISALSSIITNRHLWILLVGWVLLALCIILNILSHVQAKKNCQENISQIDNYLFQDDTKHGSNFQVYDKIKELHKDFNTKNRKLDCYYNKPTAWLMIFGVIAILAFTAVNITNHGGDHKGHKIIKAQNRNCLQENFDSLNFSQYE